MGDETAHWEGVGQITTQGGLQDYGTEKLEGEGREVSVSPTSRRYGGGGVTGSGYLRLPQ